MRTLARIFAACGLAILAEGVTTVKCNKYCSIQQILLALLFIVAGILHFVIPHFYLRIMPPYLPYPLELVYLSGMLEIVGGVGVLIPRLRRWAGHGLIALLIAVFPANIHMLLENLDREGLSGFSVVLILRLPLQFFLMAWVYWATREGPPGTHQQQRPDQS